MNTGLGPHNQEASLAITRCAFRNASGGWMEPWTAKDRASRRSHAIQARLPDTTGVTDFRVVLDLFPRPCCKLVTSRRTS